MYHISRDDLSFLQNKTLKSPHMAKPTHDKKATFMWKISVNRLENPKFLGELLV